MDYYQGVVTEYLRADRATFVNTECLIQLEPGDAPAKYRHWYCDAVAVNFRRETVYLCEITFSSTLAPLVNRLRAWSTHWPQLCNALTRDSSVYGSWRVQPWVFIPEGLKNTFKEKFPEFATLPKDGPGMPRPRITRLESVVPWNYCTWDRREDDIESDA